MLMKDHILEADKYIQPGVCRITWSNLAIYDYTQNANLVLKNIRSILQQIHRISLATWERILYITEIDLFQIHLPDVPPGTLLRCKDFFVAMENNRTERICEILSEYEGVTPVLRKMESVVLGTNTGRSPRMEHYYRYWEQQIYYAWLLLAKRNLEAFNKNLAGSEPMFQVDCVLSLPEVALRPSATEVYSIILHSCKDFVER